jgi:hypothetical protein
MTIEEPAQSRVLDVTATPHLKFGRFQEDHFDASPILVSPDSSISGGPSVRTASYPQILHSPGDEQANFHGTEDRSTSDSHYTPRSSHHLSIDRPFFDFGTMMNSAETLVHEVMSIMSLSTLKRRTIEGTDCTQPFRKTLDNYNDMSNDPELYTMILRDVVKQVCRLVQRAQRLEKYVLGIVRPYLPLPLFPDLACIMPTHRLKGTAETIEKLMLWRLQPSAENHQAIPQPFTPTSLQVAQRSASAAIDILPFPKMRDSLILNHGIYDLQSVIEDFMESIAIEVPSLGACFRITEAQTLLLEALSTLSPANVGGLRSIPDILSQISDPRHKWAWEIAHDAGLTRVHEYKVLPAFDAKYPLLNTTSSTFKLLSSPSSIIFRSAKTSFYSHHGKSSHTIFCRAYTPGVSQEIEQLRFPHIYETITVSFISERHSTRHCIQRSADPKSIMWAKYECSRPSLEWFYDGIVQNHMQVAQRILSAQRVMQQHHDHISSPIFIDTKNSPSTKHITRFSVIHNVASRLP